MKIKPFSLIQRRQLGALLSWSLWSISFCGAHKAAGGRGRDGDGDGDGDGDREGCAAESGRRWARRGIFRSSGTASPLLRWAAPKSRSSAPPRHRGRETRLCPHLAPAVLAAGFRVSPTARRAASHRGAGAQSCRPSLARGGDTRRPLPLSTFWCRCSARPAAARVLPARGVPTVTFPATPCSRGLSPTPAALPGRVPLGAWGSSGASPPAAVLLQRGASSFGQKPAGVLVC